MSGAAKAKNRRVVLGLAGILVASVALAIAAVPLYRLFCQITGYGGTTQVAEDSGRAVLDRTIKVRFAANVDRELPWRFEPLEASQTVKVGENALTFYQAENLTDRPVVGTATFNVTPHKAGLYFSKIECFCFTEQVLQPGEAVDMAVTYFIDPEIVDDPNLDGVSEITLSYTFFFKDFAEDNVAAIPAAPGAGTLTN